MGDNSCGGTYGECCQFGFSTTPGWDAVTGSFSLLILIIIFI